MRQLFLHPLKIAAAQCEKNEPLPFIYNSTVCCIPRGKSAVSSVCNIPLRSPLFSVLSGICEDSEYLLSYPRCGCHAPPVSDGWFLLSATGTVHTVRIRWHRTDSHLFPEHALLFGLLPAVPSIRDLLLSAGVASTVHDKDVQVRHSAENCRSFRKTGTVRSTQRLQTPSRSFFLLLFS